MHIRREKPACYTYPPEVLQEASRIQSEQGTDAYNQFLNAHRNEMEISVPKTKRTMQVETAPQPTTMDARVKMASRHVAQLDALVASSRQRIESLKAEIAKEEELILEREANKQKLAQFVDAFKLIEDEYKLVDSLLTPLEQLELKQKEAAAPKSNGKGRAFNRIGFSRQHYNDVVSRYNTSLQSFPANIVGGLFGFRSAEFFALDPAEAAAAHQAPKVKV